MAEEKVSLNYRLGTSEDDHADTNRYMVSKSWPVRMTMQILIDTWSVNTVCTPFLYLSSLRNKSNKACFPISTLCAFLRYMPHLSFLIFFKKLIHSSRFAVSKLYVVAGITRSSS